jgi:large subunit ribosomal protein L17
MRHHNANRKFGRDRRARKALLDSLVSNLIVRGKIKTTEPKAKELRPIIEKLITRAKGDSVATRRSIVAKLGGRTRDVKKLFEVIAPKYKDVNGGYTRVLKLGTRKADGAPMAIIEFV